MIFGRCIHAKLQSSLVVMFYMSGIPVSTEPDFSLMKWAILYTLIAFCFTAGPFCHFFFIAILRSYILRGHNSSAVNKIYKIFIAHFSAGSACLVSVSIDISHILYPVERLYCKRPIQFLASAKIMTPHPPTGRRVCSPRLWCGGGGGHMGG